MSTTTRRPRTDAAPHGTEWLQYGACAEEDPELFHPVGDNVAARKQAAQAKEVCAGCKVRELCLAWALETRQDVGVLGGMTEEERYAIHRRRGDGYWSRRRNVADYMYTHRLDEFRRLLGQGLDGPGIAAAMDTNVQTVNRLLERLRADEAAMKVVKAA
ncbi:MAG: WhiB family transcriptional regulator [Streptomyces sp.]|nr:WhiB family transcriptional regulator [Streptomyces sp.]